MKKISFFLLLVLSLLIPAGFVHAQTPTSSGPVYIVEEGDSLWSIAYRFHVSQDDLANANGITNANQITIGQQLLIPGLEGLQGILDTVQVPYGETLHSLSLRYYLTEDVLGQLNHLTSPNEIFKGYYLVIFQSSVASTPGARDDLEAGESILEMAVINNTNSWNILSNNQLENSAGVVAGEILRMPGGDDSGPGALPPGITAVSISGLEQGQTSETIIEGVEGASIQGLLMGHPLNFFQDPQSLLVALQGIHAMADPGLYTLSISATLADNTQFTFAQNVLIAAGDFLFDIPLTVDPVTLEPENTVPEDSQWRELSSPASPERLWDGVFSLPVEPVFAECYASRFGSRRSYNGSEYKYYHTGLDYCGQVGDPIYAAAAGVVVFAGPMTVRGNATMIDHGWGVYSAYMHQSEILVNVGDQVEEGQLIGWVGNTGRVEGAHLHFEILVGNIPVDPLMWLSQEYP
ncbi:MAG: hypothetical protein C3F13_12100 [Anaerolineales bacterium]|nr:LysM peptidoglycan-binding domain-containing protein [Anaerolineae bacterium]PWB52264.1 MAG: hypothetical protein C3F13_12100 [Anaerolineales bacterium]